MKTHRDFTSGKLTLVFDSGKDVNLTKVESNEFEQWFLEKNKEIKRSKTNGL